jgi:hypothetical protein
VRLWRLRAASPLQIIVDNLDWESGCDAAMDDWTVEGPVTVRLRRLRSGIIGEYKATFGEESSGATSGFPCYRVLLYLAESRRLLTRGGRGGRHFPPN